MAAWVRDSPRSMAPPGSAQLSLSERLMSRIWPGENAGDPGGCGFGVADGVYRLVP
jgi:hypothetical protein